MPSAPTVIRTRSGRLFAGLVLVLLGFGLASAQAPARLPALGLRADAVTVSGLSSGAYMAGQFEVAYSASVSGAAILAGGPYGCSRGSVANAALRCSCPAETSFAAALTGVFGARCEVLNPSFYRIFSDAALDANRGDIDATAHLARHRVWLFSGGRDAVVDPALVEAAKAFYERHRVAASALHLETRAAAGHGFPTPDAALPCGSTASPYLIDCQHFDAAGALLRWLYPDLPANPGTLAAGALRPFSQTPYRPSGFSGLDASGWIYVPAACERSGAQCRLHVVFHGCEQGQSFVTAAGRRYGKRFVEGTGYNRWAEAAGIVVLYPQIRVSHGAMLGDSYRDNPKGCWDFWGYSTGTADTAPQAFGRRQAPQMRAVKAMIDDLLRP